MSPVKDYLERTIAMLATLNLNRCKLHGYLCFEDFVLQHGRRFTRLGKMPRSVKTGKANHCFMNAAQLSLSIPSLIYCEGFATGIIPVMHAWCITRTGTIIDPTWNDGLDYFGIPIKHTYLMSSMMKYGVYGVIDLWKEGFPILRAKPDQFMELI